MPHILCIIVQLDVFLFYELAPNNNRIKSNCKVQIVRLERAVKLSIEE